MQPSFQSLLAADASREQIEEWCRHQSRALPIAHSTVLSRVLGKYLMYTLCQDLAITPHLAFNGIWEPWVTMAIARHVKPGMRCLDVGACYGYYSILMADLAGQDGRVEAWEPIYSELVTANAGLNGLAVVTQPCAMGTAGGSVKLYRDPGNEIGLYNAGGGSPVTDHRNEPDDEFEVEVREPAGLYDFIKIDVEGAEADVWKALRVGRFTDPVTVCMEFTPSKHVEPSLFLLDIVSDGFRLGTVGHDGVPRECSIEEALVPDTGDFRMLWLTRRS